MLLPLARKISPAIRVGSLDAPHLFSPLITASQVRPLAGAGRHAHGRGSAMTIICYGRLGQGLIHQLSLAFPGLP